MNNKKPKFRRIAFKIHKWAGLGAGIWFFVLGATGIVLGHDEWRWARQMTVPSTWIPAASADSCRRRRCAMSRSTPIARRVGTVNKES